MMAHLFVLLLQCLCLYFFKIFTPQEVQFGIINKYKYLFPNDQNDMLLNDDNMWMTKTLDMLHQLFEYPLYSVFPFLEVAIAVYVWSELLYPSTNCNNITPLSSYYYPILISLFDMSKFNLYNAGKHLNRSEYTLAVASLLDLYSFFYYIFLSILLSMHFVYSVIKVSCHLVYQTYSLGKPFIVTTTRQSAVNNEPDNIITSTYRDTELTQINEVVSKLHDNI